MVLTTQEGVGMWLEGWDGRGYTIGGGDGLEGKHCTYRDYEIGGRDYTRGKQRWGKEWGKRVGLRDSRSGFED